MAEPVFPDDSLRHQLTRKQLQTLQGAWEFVWGTRDARLVIDGNSYQITFKNGDVYQGTFELDPMSRPNAIDLRIDDGPERHRGKESRGIYLLDSDHLMLCPGVPGSGDRLAAFPEPDDRTQLRLVFRKNKTAR
jgi:uncharacterized protein (TIGR03067 family)